MTQREVVTIHGISTDGEWQEMIECVLGPHFRCTSLKYPHYRRLGALKLIVHPTVLVGSVAVVLAVLWFGRMGSLYLAAGLFALAVAVSHVAARIFRHQAVNHVHKLFVPGQGLRAPHFIGHSLGTYLCGTLLLRSEDLEFDRMILTGCVLPVDYHWKTLISHGRKGCKQVRNEVGRRDLVVWLAFFLHGWLGQFGRAGYRGFSSLDGTTHNLDGPYERCAKCAAGDCALVHNVSHPEAGHSDLFITPKHCDRFWLPFLLGIEPQEYRDFGMYCIEAATLEADDPKHELPVVLATFVSEAWKWAGGTVADVLRDRIRKLVSSPVDPAWLESVVDGAVRLTCGLHTAARALQCERLKRYLSGHSRGVSLFREFLEDVGIDDQLVLLGLSADTPADDQEVILQGLDLYRLLDQACGAALTEVIAQYGLPHST